MSYSKSVFINCPFDREYKNILEKLIFILSFYNFEIYISTTTDSASDRLLTICDYIKKSKFTIHDLSRHKSTKRREYARFNMPFELGIDFGCYQYGKAKKDKVIAVIDKNPHTYDRYLSDLSGRDILYHENDSNLLFQVIPNWLTVNTGKLYDSPKKLSGYHAAWIIDYKSRLKKRGYDLRTLSKISIPVYQNLLKEWLPTWKSSNNYTDP